MFKVRPYTKDDFQMINSWWVIQGEVAPTLAMLPEESTFICEFNGLPLTCITVYLTNSMEFCILDNFVGNPGYANLMRKEASALVISHAEKFAKDFGYKSMLCFAIKDKLKQYYPKFGYVKRCDNLTSFNKELV